MLGGMTPSYGYMTPSYDPSRTPLHGGAWDPSITNTPRPDDYDTPSPAGVSSLELNSVSLNDRLLLYMYYVHTKVCTYRK